MTEDLNKLEAKRRQIWDRYSTTYGPVSDYEKQAFDYACDKISAHLAAQRQSRAVTGDQGALDGVWSRLKSLVYGGGNCGADGKDDGGHRLIKGQISYDDWETIRAALTNSVPQEVTDALGIAVAALRDIACFEDGRANNYLDRNGSYSAFDEPGSVQTAREALALLSPHLKKDGG